MESHPTPRLRAPAAIAIAIVFTGCAPKDRQMELPAFDGRRAYAEVAELVKISPRDAGTPAGWKAAKHLEARMKSFGVETSLVTFTDNTPEGEKTMNNVIGTLPGKTKRWIILGSHFDTMPGIENFQGANDSGSSTGVLLELARILAESGVEPEVGIIFAFFDGEEGIANYIPGDGLHGSRHMARRLAETGKHHSINAMILLDMVGDKDLQITIPLNSSSDLIKATINAAHATGHREHFKLTRSVITDDHVPFLDIGVPAIDLIDFNFGSKPDANDYWHTSADNMESISAESLAVVGDVTLEMLRRLALEPAAE